VPQSDESILAHIRSELATSPHVKQYKLTVSYTGCGSISITGTVRSYFHKQIANEAVRKVLQNTKTTILFKNDIDVVSESHG
jgi:osmotically-inducible protein OsmY